MGGYSLFDYVILIISGLIIGYVFVRILTFGAMKSYFDVKTNFIHKMKQTKGGKEDASTSKKINEG